MPLLTPVSPTKIDARLRQHLQVNERVLWQSRPRQGSFFNTGVIAASLGLILVGMLLAMGLAGGVIASDARIASSLALVLAGLLLLASGWMRRAELWVYAVTDKRLLTVLGDKIIRSVTPEKLDRLELRVKDDIVYWFKQSNNTNSRSIDRDLRRGPDGQYVGFHGQSDAEAIKAMIEAWRVGISRSAPLQPDAFPEPWIRRVHPVSVQAHQATWCRTA